MAVLQECLDLLLKRRSVKAADMKAPGPSKDQLDAILQAASRVPDHGKVVPFYFMVFAGDQRQKAGDKVADIFQKHNPDAPADKVQVEKNRFNRAPCVVAVIYRQRRGKHPLWEQAMTAGAACQNLLVAAHATGFVGQWLSEWYAYDDEMRRFLGLDARDVVAGFIHLGSPPNDAPQERERPDLNDIVTHWSPDVDVKKGGQYDRPKFPFPALGFKPISNA